MRKHHIRLLTAAGSVVAAGAIALSGTLAATAAPHAARAGASGIERFQFMTIDPTGAKNAVIARGVFTAGGIDISTSNTTDTFKFPNGTIRTRHTPGTGPHSFNPRTCLATAHLHATYTLLGGTGKYAGISGHGKVQAQILAVFARSHGKCSHNKPPIAFEQLIRAAGPVHL